jgi:tetratricopeptide (TPR) repeat protein/tRNA A-37 threonylcarbamoyl transferase component Bud32
VDRGTWQAAKELFRSALERPESEREAFVADRSLDEAVRTQVLRLLRLHSETSEFLEPPIGSAPDAASDAHDPMIGRDLGGFRVMRRLGQGGMSIVYEAMQERPHRRAAVKVLRPGRLSPRIQRRFEFESEILARLQHPGIAQVLASGTFEIDGGTQRWFAMELVEGPTLPELLAATSPSRTWRVELLISLCDAVQHAHQRGVIHRDLKPDNIRMARGDPGPDTWWPKILDFGVARLVDAEGMASMHTVAGELIGTLAYMSPEQLSGNPDLVDARSDVYALGVIGYELLCGRLPHETESPSVAELIRTIADEEPERAGTLDPSLRGDLEVILAKALEKAPERRYPSAAELAADLRRHLRHEPISARPATVVYQLRKFSRRHRALVGGVAAALLALVAGLVLSIRAERAASREAANARYEADKAATINNFITNDFLMKLLAAANTTADAPRLPITELVEKAAGSIETMFAGQPTHEAALRNEVGTIFYNLGNVDAAADQFSAAMRLWESQLGPDHADTLKAVNNLGQTRARQRRVEEAESLYRRALDGRRRVLGSDDPYTLVTMNNLAELCRGTDRLDEAEQLLRQTLAVQRRVQGSTHKNTITTLGNLATLLLQRERQDEGLAMLREAHEASLATLGADHVMTALTGFRLGTALQKASRAGEAEFILSTAAESLDRSLGPDSSESVSARRALARAYRDLAQPERARDQLQRALDAVRARHAPGDDRERKLLRDLEALR